jgi:hypothetical protein
MPYVRGFLNIVSGDQPDNSLPGGEHPDQGLPGAPLVPGNALPSPPLGVWPPPTISHPIVPAPPNVPPGTIWPSPGRPSNELPSTPGRPSQGLPGTPDNTLPQQPGRPDQGLPSTPGRPDNSLPSSSFWVVAGIPGVGWRYICVDPSLEVGMPLPPTATPKK